MIIKFFDVNSKVANALANAFGGIEKVEVYAAPIFRDANGVDFIADAIISPANSFGWMDGGIDLAYLNFFGHDLQARLKSHIASSFHGELPVGRACGIMTVDPRIKWLISAPTMRTPGVIHDPQVVHHAFRAALIVANNIQNQDPMREITVLCPGMGTATGRVDPEVAATFMYQAYCDARHNGLIMFDPPKSHVYKVHRNDNFRP